MTITATATHEDPDALLYRVKVALKDAGFMQAITDDRTGVTVNAGYQLLPRATTDGPRARLEFSMRAAQRDDTATQQQRMQIRYAMTAAYTAVLQAAGFHVLAGVTGITNRPYLTISRTERTS